MKKLLLAIILLASIITGAGDVTGGCPVNPVEMKVDIARLSEPLLDYIVYVQEGNEVTTEIFTDYFDNVEDYYAYIAEHEALDLSDCPAGYWIARAGMSDLVIYGFLISR